MYEKSLKKSLIFYNFFFFVYFPNLLSKEIIFFNFILKNYNITLNKINNKFFNNFYNFKIFFSNNIYICCCNCFNSLKQFFLDYTLLNTNKVSFNFIFLKNNLLSFNFFKKEILNFKLNSKFFIFYLIYLKKYILFFFNFFFNKYKWLRYINY